MRRSGAPGRRWRCAPVAALACGALAALGCNGGDGISRYRVSGTVSFDGHPVPGRYDTTAKGGRHAIAGPHQVVIEGHDPGPAGAAGEVAGRPLFGGHRVSLDLPAAASQHDFDVPASAATSIVN